MVFAVELAFSVVAGQMVLLAVLGQYAAADEVQTADRSPYWTSFCTVTGALAWAVSILFSLNMLGGVLFGESHEAIKVAPSAATMLSDPGLRFFVLIAELGVRQMILAMAFIPTAGAFAWVLPVILGVGRSEVLMLGRKMMLGMPRLSLSLVLGAMIVVALSMPLPLFLSLPVVVLAVGWMYVGAREVFTGTKANSPVADKAKAGQVVLGAA